MGRRTFKQAGETPGSTTGFTIVELLVVMAIILVLAALVLGTSSYVHNRSARSRTETEIAAMSAALDSYKADQGVYPSDHATDTLDPTSTTTDTKGYESASLALYKILSGDSLANGQPTQVSYLSFKNTQLQLDSSNNITFIKDPFGNSYGYSTKSQSDIANGRSPTGYNPTFDLWSTANSTSGQVGWIKNW